MIRKRLVLVLHSFCLSLLLIGSFAYIQLEEFITRNHAIDSVKQLSISYFIPLRASLVIRDSSSLSSLVNQILMSDKTMLLVQIKDRSGRIYQAERRGGPDIDPDHSKYNTVDLTSYDINEFGGILSKRLIPDPEAITVIERSFSDVHGKIGSIRLVMLPDMAIRPLLNNIAIGGSLVFLLNYVICFLIFSTANRSLRNYYSLLKQISRIDYSALGITPPELRPKADDATSISQTFSVLVEEVKKSYAELSDQNYELKTSKELFKSFMDSMSEGVLIRDRYRNVIYANDSFMRLIGVKDDLRGKKIDSYLSEKLQGVDFDTDLEITNDVNFLNRKIELEERVFDLKKFSAVASRNQMIIATVVREITAEVKANKEKAHFQRRMFISSKLASLGVLASGVAHEMYNPLTVLVGNLELLKRDCPATEDSSTRLERMSTAVDKMKNFVDRLRALDRPGGDRKFRKVSINSVIESASELLSSTLFTSSIELDLELAPKLPDFFGDESLIENALINLFINAKDAFDSMISEEVKKVITIKTMLSPAGNICVEFSDNACGIPEDIQDKLFDPLFTTNEVKKSGLGLSLVREIVHQHDGDLFFFSTEGRGTTFKFYIPKYKIENDVNDSIRPRPRGREFPHDDITILFVHKNTDFGEVVRDYLMGHYNVISFTDINDVDEGMAKSCDFAFGECSGDLSEGKKLVETLRKLSSELPFVVVGRDLDDEMLKKDLFNKGASDVVSRDLSELDALHELISKYI